jgi:hypothetical protein
MVVPAGMILLESPSGRKLAISAQSAQAMALTDRLSSLTLLISITAILALLAWQSLFPSRRDYLALAALPVRSRQIFTARFACVLLMAGVITFFLLLPPGASPPHPIKLAGGALWMPHSTAAARMTATAFGCVFIFFALVGLNGLLVNTLPARWVARCGGGIQGLLLGAAPGMTSSDDRARADARDRRNRSSSLLSPTARAVSLKAKKGRKAKNITKLRASTSPMPRPPSSAKAPAMPSPCRSPLTAVSRT